MIEVSNFKKGVCIEYKGAPMMIVDVTFSTPTARGANTIAKTKLRNLLTGQLINESIRTGDKFSEVDREQRPIEYLYNDGKRWRLHYVTAREMYNLVKAAEAGETGDPGMFRDFVVSPPPAVRRS